ncbi:MAG: hypothetical protein Q7S21_07105 [archaeon]|nr:hypothetical protein [archaeon]
MPSAQVLAMRARQQAEKKASAAKRKTANKRRNKKEIMRKFLGKYVVRYRTLFAKQIRRIITPKEKKELEKIQKLSYHLKD